MKKVLVSRSLLALGALGMVVLPGIAQAQNRSQNQRANGQSGQIRNNNFGSIVTLEGVVTRVDDSNRNTGRFQIQAGGKRFDVQSSTSFPVREGQRVVLRGNFEGDNNFNARTVTLATSGGNIGRPNSPYGDSPYSSNPNRPRGGDNWHDNDAYGNDYRSGNDQLVNFPGVVTRVLNRDELEIRADNGRTYRVSLRRTSSEYQVGNRIRVVGNASGNRVENARLTFQNGGVVGPIYGGSYGGNSSDGTFGDGTYGNRPSRNDGGFRNGPGTRNGGYGNGNGSYNGNNGSFGNGRGEISGGVENGRSVDFSGRIVTINANDLTRSAIVRGDNGQQYAIRGKDLKNRRVGERIRVRGTMENNVVVASNIDDGR